MPNLKEVEILGKPGNICLIVNSDERFEGLPSHGIAWGPFGEDGTFRVLVDAERYPIIIDYEYDYSDELVKKLERSWHINSA